MPTLLHLNSADLNGVLYSVSASRCVENEIPMANLKLAFAVAKAGTEKTFFLTFDTEAGSITLSGFDIPNDKFLCIGTCGITKLAGHAWDCWKLGKRRPNAIWDCLVGKGHTIAGDTLQCITGCLAQP